MLRLMCDNYERGLYEGEEYQYWQKVSALNEILDLLSRLPEPAIEQAAWTLLDLHESWEWVTQEERKDPVLMMIQEVGVDVGVKRVIWIKARPDFNMLFQDNRHDFPGFKEFFYKNQVPLVVFKRYDICFLAPGLGNSFPITRRLEELNHRATSNDIGSFRF